MMSIAREHEAAASSGILQRIPAELWNKILHGEQGFTVEDFKNLCFVAPLFKTICQPLAYRSLDVRGVEGFYGYSFETGWRKQGAMTDLVQWKWDVKCLIQAERRLCLVGSDPSLSTFPQTMSIGDMPGGTVHRLNMQHPPTDKMVLSKAAYNTFLQFKYTLVRTLPSFTHLRRLELCLLPIDDGLLRAIASHSVLHELHLGICSFSSPTFPIPSIRLLECNRLSQEHAPAAFRLASCRHLEELRIKNMDISAVMEGFCARPESESMLTKLRRLTISPTSAMLDLLEVESLLHYVPALRELDIVYNDLEEHRFHITVPEGSQAMKSSTVPYLRRLLGPLSFAPYIIPGRPVSDIRSGDGEYSFFVETWPELQAHLYPLSLSAVNAEGITTLHLPKNVAPIWLLSRFVAETFPRLVDLRLPVGMAQDFNPEDEDLTWCYGNFSRPRRLLDAEGPFGDGVVEGMVKDIRDSVEYELVIRFDDPGHQTMDLDHERRRISSHPLTISASVSSPQVDVSATLVRRMSGIELDSTGRPSRHPHDCEEALIYFAQGWYPLPTGIQTLSLLHGSFPRDFRNPFGASLTVEQRTYIAVVAALGERYPNLGAATFIGPYSYRCEKIRGVGSGTTRWDVTEMP